MEVQLVLTHVTAWVSGEIARQNKITEQILTQYIQRKFFPHLSPPQLPRIDYLAGANRQATVSETDDTDPDALETVETEQISKVYDEEKTTEEGHESESDEENIIEGGPR